MCFALIPVLSNHHPFTCCPIMTASIYGCCRCVIWQKNIGPWKFKVIAAVVFGIPTSFTKASGWEGWAFGHWHSNNTTHHIYFQKQQVNLPCSRTLAQSCQKHWGPYIKLSESCMGNVELSDNFSICAELQINGNVQEMFSEKICILSELQEYLVWMCTRCTQFIILYFIV